MDETGSTGQVPYTRVTVAEAAAALGVNVVTIRRMIKRGQLEAERVHRPQGSAYLVTLPGHGAGDETPTGQPAQDMSRTQETPAEQMMAAWSASVLTPILAPIVAELTATRQQLVSQAETIGRQSAELDAARAQISTLLAHTEAQAAEPTTEPPQARWSRWVEWSPTVVLLVVTLVLAVLLLVPQ